MSKNSFLFPFFIVFIVFSMFVIPSSQAASVKERMAARIPAINSLKAKGVVGENNAGYLAYRSGAKPQQKLVADENKDRGAVYNAIAKKQGATAILVGQRRATMIAKKGKKGHLFQKPDGTWYKK